MPRGLTSLAAILVAALYLAGCGSSGHAPISSTVADGTAFQPTSKTFSITAPPGWKGLNSDSLADGAAAAARRNPELVNEGAQLKLLAKNPNLVFLVDGSKGGRTLALKTGFAVNSLARSVPMDVNLSNSGAEAAVVKQYHVQADELHFTIAKNSTTLAGHPAVHLTYTVPINTADGIVRARESDTILVWNKNLYIVSLTAPAAHATDYATTFANMLQSFKIG